MRPLVAPPPLLLLLQLLVVLEPLLLLPSGPKLLAAAAATCFLLHSEDEIQLGRGSGGAVRLPTALRAARASLLPWAPADSHAPSGQAAVKLV